MASLNKVFLIGNLTADPELRYTPNQVPVTDLKIAVNRYFGKESERKNEVTYVDVVVWSHLAENCTKYLEKGRPVMVEGRLQLDTWEDKQGEKRSRLRVVAENIQFLGGKQREGGESKQAKVKEPESAGEDIPAESLNEDDIPF